MKIEILGSKGKLSSELKKFNYKNINCKDRSKILNQTNNTIKVATYSPTLLSDTKENYEREISYYKSLIRELDNSCHLVFISSQTLELTNITFYSQAKDAVEKLLIKNLKNYTIIRPGMIFDQENNLYLLDQMNNASNSFLSFHNDLPKTTICSSRDIYDLIDYVSNNIDQMNLQIINIGLKRHRFFELQTIYQKRKCRLKIIPFLLLRLIAKINIRLKSYVVGRANSSSPSLGWRSSFDWINK